jgi:hypothetical protein
MHCWLTEAIKYTFGSVRSLQHYASAIVYKTPGLLHVGFPFSENSYNFTFDSNLSNLMELVKMAYVVEDDCISAINTKLLFHCHVDFSYGNILFDHPREEKPSYSLLTDD